MASVSAWVPLKVANAFVPTLLVKHCFGIDGYTVYLTDLGFLWKEDLDVDDVTQRASDEDCSIDPSENTDQFQILLDKIKAAVNGDRGTKLSIHADGNGPDLTLRASAPLPLPLQPIEWPLRLSRQPPEALQTELLAPLLALACSQEQQVAQLAELLREKDRVISRLLDRLDASGTDLPSIFPGLSGIKTDRKGSQRAQLVRHVKGLAAFDKDAHQRAFEVVTIGEVPASVILGSIFSRVPQSGQGLQLFKPTRETRQWWERLADISVEQDLPQTPYQSQSLLIHGAATTMNIHGSETEDDDFQVDLRSSPHTSPKKPHTKTPSEFSTADEDDIDVPPENSIRLPSAAKQRIEEPASLSTQTRKASTPKTSPSKLSKFGVIGGGKRREASPDRLSDTAMTVNSNRTAYGSSQTLFGSDIVGKDPPRRKLGAIGGKSKSQSSQTPSLESSNPHALQGSLVKRNSTLEVITSKQDMVQSSSSTAPAANLAVLDTAEEPRSCLRSRDKTPGRSPSPRETSVERADRKRAELKRELEAKAKAPVKQKRKF
ncbi:hypothetical protein LTR66_007499 [Elasticomyces elasticus]|nr:hypothetical protein LTR66_007499 [Elasticomyces elasticus]